MSIDGSFIVIFIRVHACICSIAESGYTACMHEHARSYRGAKQTDACMHAWRFAIYIYDD